MRTTDWLLLAVTAAVFAPGLVGGFVYDDPRLVVQNAALVPFDVGAFFTMDLWAGVPGQADSGFYRPLMLASLGLDRALFGLEPLGFKAHSLAWHLLAVAALLRLLRELEIPALPAAIGAAVFALHPAQVEAVAFIAARNDAMAAAFLLAAVTLLVRPGTPRLVGGALLIALAGLCKESAVLAPLVVLAFTRQGRPTLAAAVGAAVPLGLRTLSGVGAPDAAIGEALARSPQALAVWSATLFDPRPHAIGPHLDWASPSLLWLVPGLLVVGLAAWRSDARGRAGLALAGLVLAPSLLAVGANGLVPDRYLYLPLAGLGVAVGTALQRVPRLRLVAFGVVAALAFASSFSVPIWRDDVLLRQATRAERTNPYTHGSLAKSLGVAGDLDRAAGHYQAATQPPRPFEHACFNVTSIHLERMAPHDAVTEGLRALDAGCDASPELVAPMALGMALEGDWDEAERWASRLTEDPTGKAVLVRAGAAALRGELDVLADEAAVRGGSPEALAGQVVWVLRTSGSPEAAEQVHARYLR